jgi:histidinol-phosphate/aromatic aminotransferase/cobyric acid decarboxylase-like protein
MTTDFLQESSAFIKTERQKLMDKLLSCGYKVYPSDTNFILIYSEEDLYKRYLERGILIRDCSNFRGLGKGFYRIAVKNSK